MHHVLWLDKSKMFLQDHASSIIGCFEAKTGLFFLQLNIDNACTCTQFFRFQKT